MNNLKDGSLWLQPPRTWCGGVCKKKRIFTLNPTSWSFEGGDSIANEAIRTMMLYHFHLAIGVRGWGYDIAPWGTALLRIWGACVPDRETVLCQSGGILNIPVVDRVVDQSLAIS